MDYNSKIFRILASPRSSKIDMEVTPIFIQHLQSWEMGIVWLIKATKLVSCPSLYLLYSPNSPPIGNSLNCKNFYNLLSTFPFPESTRICRNLSELFWLSSHFIVQTRQILSHFICINIIILSLLARRMCNTMNFKLQFWKFRLFRLVGISHHSIYDWIWVHK